MLLDNKKLTLIKYQGTTKFIAGLLIEETTKQHYFYFMPTETPTISITNDNYSLETKIGEQITFIEKYFTVFEAKGKTFGKNDKMFSLIPIDQNEFDSLYNLLECVWND